MKLTNAEILNVKGPIQQLIQQKLPIKTSLALLKLVRKLNEFLIPAEQVRDGLVRTYGEPDEANPNQIGVKPDSKNWKKFMEEYAELLSQENEVVFEKVSLPDTLEIEPAVLMALEKFIKIA